MFSVDQISSSTSKPSVSDGKQCGQSALFQLAEVFLNLFLPPKHSLILPKITEGIYLHDIDFYLDITSSLGQTIVADRNQFIVFNVTDITSSFLV